MIKINILDSSVYNKISAGEVVERPRSIVKELVENSIDAGATHIDVSIFDGGKSLIEISDNGCGINNAYAKTAFLPHATSKITTSDDLFKVSTLGFRGEALASIAAVSQVELFTQALDEDCGTHIVVRGGEFIREETIARDRGATIKVKDLFFNTPAREKFLKSNKGEEQEITSLMSEFLLANPNVAFTYKVDDKTIYLSSGSGLFDAVYSVYDKKLIENLLPLDYSSGGIMVKGYISNAEYTKSTRSYQTTIINGRVITNTNLAVAVSQAYGITLMKRAFPVYILDITMPFEMLDVNVHPNKSEVRFSDARLMFSKVYGAVAQALKSAAKIFSIDGNTTENVSRAINCGQGKNNNTFFDKNTTNYYENRPNSEYSVHAKVDNAATIASTAIMDKFKNIVVDTQQRQNMILNEPQELMSPQLLSDILNIDANRPNALREEVKSSTEVHAENVLNKNTSEQINIFSDIDNSCQINIRIVGQIFDTYLLVSFLDGLYVLDQHACHEKLIYDKLKGQLENGKLLTQPLLIPQIHTLQPQDFGYIVELIEELKNIGLEIEEFGNNTIKVTQIPVSLKEFKLKNFIDEILSDKNRFSKVKIGDLLRDRLAITACKAAIKSGDKLNDFEIKSLLLMMKDSVPLQCPHGRPAIIKVERKDIDKLFKRII